MADKRFVVVDGSNLATEGRTLPSLAQLDQAVRAYSAEDPDAELVVVVDASFEHRIDASEAEQLEQAELHGEVVSPPAGAIGRGDAFVLRIAERTGAAVLSNDSFQEFHAEHPWLFDEGRLIGGKPVPGVGWIFTPRVPVRGPKSRQATKEKEKSKRRASDRIDPVEKAAELAQAAKKVARIRKATTTRNGDGSTPRIGDVWVPPSAAAAAAPDDGATDAAGEAAPLDGGVPEAAGAAEEAPAAPAKRAAKATKAAKTTKATKKADKTTKKAAKTTKKAAKKAGATAEAEPEKPAKATKKAAKATPATAKAAKATKATKAAKDPADKKEKAKEPKAKATKAAKAAPAKKAGKATSAARGTDAADAEVTGLPRIAPTRADRTMRKAIADATGEALDPPEPEGMDESPKKGKRRRRSGATPPPAVNEPLTFINFVAAYPVGSMVEGEVVSFTSHGAMVEVPLPDGETLHCYIPLSGLGTPPPTKARDVLTRGERRPFELIALDPPRRVAELAIPGLATPA